MSAQPEPACEEPAPPTDPEPAAAGEVEEGEKPVRPLDEPIQIRDDPPSDEPGAGVSQASILRALTQLLVEKDLITRDELIDRVHRANAYPGPERRKA